MGGLFDLNKKGWNSLCAQLTQRYYLTWKISLEEFLTCILAIYNKRAFKATVGENITRATLQIIHIKEAKRKITRD
jgi:hypothetical protein